MYVHSLCWLPEERRLLQKAQAHQTGLKAPSLLLATLHFTVFRTWYMEWMKYFVTLVILL